MTPKKFNLEVLKITIKSIGLVFGIVFLISLFSSNCKAESLTVSPFGITMHGPKVSKRAADEMSRKLDSSGRFAYHPEINLVYRDEKLILTAALLDDCFGKTSGVIGLGRRLYLSQDETWDISAVLGVFVRPNAPRKDSPVTFKTNGLDIIPLPLISFSKRYKLNLDTSLELSVGTNYYITHGTIGFNISF